MTSILNKFSLSDCEKILKKKLETTEFVADSYEFQPADGLGFMADYFLLNIKYKINEDIKNSQFFVKGICSIISQRDFASESGAYGKELCMYEDIIPEFERYNIDIIHECIPRCYLITDKINFIFENIKVQGYKCLNHRESMDLDSVKICLESLAIFHCTSLVYEEKSGTKINERFPSITTETFYGNVTTYNMIEPGLKGAITQINLFEKDSQIDLEAYRQFACDTYRNFPQLVGPSDIYRNVICHCDLWATNIMYKFEGNTPIHSYIIDFQSYRYVPPAQDFMIFLYLSTDRELRNTHLEELIIYYHEKMAEILKKYDMDIEKILPLTELKDSCDYYKLFAIAQAAIVYPHILIPPDEVQIIMDEPKGMFEILFEDCSDVILKMIKKDETYVNRLSENMAEFKEIFVKKNRM